MAMLEAIKILGYQLDRIITVDVWATDTIPAELPPMVEFKEYADEQILKRYGIKVEHFNAGTTYEQEFYRTFARGKHKGELYGFPMTKGAWCNSRLKMAGVSKADRETQGATHYVGIASDEPKRIERHKQKLNVIMPLVDIGWTETDCRKWCEENELLSPIYQSASRGGCWFCHNQSTEQLRQLRKNYPQYWELMLKWDSDSITTFKAGGKTVHDYELRFQAEDDGLIDMDNVFRWDDVYNQQITFDYLMKKGEIQ